MNEGSSRSNVRFKSTAISKFTLKKKERKIKQLLSEYSVEYVI